MDRSARRILTTDDLHSYVDDRLNAVERMEIERRLGEDERAAKAVEDYRRQADALRLRLDQGVAPAVNLQLRAYAERLTERLRSLAGQRQG